MHTYQCKVCGAETERLAQHIADEHYELLCSCVDSIDHAAEVFGVCKWTVGKIKTLAGLINKKICKRCGREYESRGRHLLEYHMPLLMCARYTLGLEQPEICAMFFAGSITKNDVSDAFQELKRADYSPVDRDDLPQLGLPISIEGSTVRIMERGEVGIGHIFVDEALSWLTP